MTEHYRSGGPPLKGLSAAEEKNRDVTTYTTHTHFVCNRPDQ